MLSRLTQVVLYAVALASALFVLIPLRFYDFLPEAAAPGCFLLKILLFPVPLACMLLARRVGRQAQRGRRWAAPQMRRAART